MQEERIKYYANVYLGSKPTLYSIESEAVPGLYYAVKGNDFMVLRGKQIYHIDLHEEAEEWIRRCRIPEMADEMADIVADCKEYKRGDLIFGQGIPIPRGNDIRTVHLHRSILKQIGG